MAVHNSRRCRYIHIWKAPAGRLKDGVHTMNSKTEGTVAIVAALLVLFSAMLNATLSATVAVVALVGLGLYRLLRKEG